MLIANNIKIVNQTYSYKNNKRVSFEAKLPNKTLKPDYIPDLVWAAEQEVWKNYDKASCKNLFDAIWDGYIKGKSQLRPIMDYIANKIFLDINLSPKQMISKTNEAFRLYEKLVANNPPKTVNKFNPIDMTTILKVLQEELNCKDLKFEGLKNIEHGYLGEQVLQTYDSLAELIKFAQTQCKNKDIIIKFNKPNALYTTLTYEGPAIDNKDLKKILPKNYYYSDTVNKESNIIISKNKNKTSITIKMYTLDEIFSGANLL